MRTDAQLQDRNGEAAGRSGPRQRLVAGLPVRERRLELAGIPTAVLEGGQGAPIVLLHGPGEYGAKWFRVIPDLVQTHRVIAPDLPGHGETAPIDGDFGPERLLDWLDALIEETCPEPPALVGQILAGAIAAHFAADRGPRIARLVLTDALGLAPFEPAPEFGAALTEFMTAPDGDSHDRFWQLCAYDLDSLRERMGDGWQRLRAYNLDRAAAAELKPTQHALFGLFGLPVIPDDQLARIAAPTTLIWGRHDLATPVSVAEGASARFGWALHVIEDAADDPAIEQPAAFVAALRAALAKP